MSAFQEGFHVAVRQRLDLQHDGFQAMRRDGLPVDSVAPQGAIYCTCPTGPSGAIGRYCPGVDRNFGAPALAACGETRMTRLLASRPGVRS